jgi:hypothetical protein
MSESLRVAIGFLRDLGCYRPEEDTLGVLTVVALFDKNHGVEAKCLLEAINADRKYEISNELPNKLKEVTYG